MPRRRQHLIDVFQKGLLKQAQEALRIAQFSFLQGDASLLEVLDAQRVQQQILFDYTQARFDLSVALIRLERLSAAHYEHIKKASSFIVGSGAILNVTHKRVRLRFLSSAASLDSF